MKKTVVLYKSKYGSTKKYAQWISEELKCDLFECSEVKIDRLKDYDTIVFGGGLYAIGINGVKCITKNYEDIKDKNIVVFTVGLSSTDDKSIFKPVIEKNFTEEMQSNIEFFHLRGAMDYKRLNLLHKSMMAMLKRMVSKKSEDERTKDDEEILETYGKRIDFTDVDTIQPLILHINKNL